MGPRSWVPLGRPGTDQRRATAPRALAKAGSTPDDARASDAGGIAGARSERREWAREMGRSEKQTTQGGGAWAEMAAAANAEWGGRTAVWCREAYDRRASVRYF